MSAQPYTKRSQVAAMMSKALRDYGYPDCTDQIIMEVMAAFLEGKREEELPHGVLGRFAGRQFQEVEDVQPGFLAGLATD